MNQDEKDIHAREKQLRDLGLLATAQHELDLVRKVCANIVDPTDQLATRLQRNVRNVQRREFDPAACWQTSNSRTRNALR